MGFTEVKVAFHINTKYCVLCFVRNPGFGGKMAKNVCHTPKKRLYSKQGQCFS